MTGVLRGGSTSGAAEVGSVHPDPASIQAADLFGKKKCASVSLHGRRERVKTPAVPVMTRPLRFT